MSDVRGGTGPTADVSVRVAWADDAAAIADVQVRAWREQYADVLPADALPDDTAVVAEAWRSSMTRPADARNRVLVALERNRVVGFAVTSPAADPDCDPLADGELADLTVVPGELGKGHGSRLLQAAADTLVADRFTPCRHVGHRHRRRAPGVPHQCRLGGRLRPPRAGPGRHRHHPRQAGPAPHRPRLTSSPR